MGFKSIHTIKLFVAHVTGEDSRPRAFPFVAGQTIIVQECFATATTLKWTAVMHLTGTRKRRNEIREALGETYRETRVHGFKTFLSQ